MNMLTHQDDRTREAFDPNHPSPAQWVGWLYGECTRREHARLEAHLEACAECRGQLSRWQTVTKELNAGALPKSQPARASWLPVIKWAAAALLILGVGFMLGWRSHNPDREFAAWRQQLRSEWQADFRQATVRLRADLETSQKAGATELASRVLDYSRKATEQYAQQFARNYEIARQTESVLVWDRLEELEDHRANDYAALRKDLETLALTAAGEFWKTRRQLGGLIELAEGKGGNTEVPRLPQ